MTVVRAAKWVGGLFVTACALLLASIFVADRQLEAPFAAVDLAPLAIPTSAPLADGLLLYNADPGGTHEIFVAAVDGSGSTQLTDDSAYDSWRPRLSPDRTTVLFYRTPAGTYDRDPSKASLWMMDAGGGGVVEVLPAHAHGWIAHGHAEWSPNGHELVMVGVRPEGSWIWIASVDGRDIRSVSREPEVNTHPSWAPDGKRIIYVSCPTTPCQPAQREVFVVAAAGGDRTQITTQGLVNDEPSISPDGRQIVMRTQVQPPDEDGDNAAFILRVVPTNRREPPRVLEGSMGASAAPQWLDTDRIVFELDGDVLVSAAAGDATVLPILQSSAIEAYPSS